MGSDRGGEIEPLRADGRPCGSTKTGILSDGFTNPKGGKIALLHLGLETLTEIRLRWLIFDSAMLDSLTARDRRASRRFFAFSLATLASFPHGESTL